MVLLQNLKRKQEESGVHGKDGEDSTIKQAEKYVHQVRLNHLT